MIINAGYFEIWRDLYLMKGRKNKNAPGQESVFLPGGAGAYPAYSLEPFWMARRITRQACAAGRGEASGYVRGCHVEQRHFVAVQQFFDVHQDQHTVAERAEAGQVFGGQRNRELRCRTDLIGGQ